MDILAELAPGAAMGYFQRILVLFVLCGTTTLLAQAPDISSGEINVMLVQSLDSSANPTGISQATVTKSSNPAIPVMSRATVGLMADPASGGYSARLLTVAVSGRSFPAASSNVSVLGGPGLKITIPPPPKPVAAGNHVFLPERTLIHFTLMAAPVAPAPPPPPPQRSVTVASAKLPFVKWTEKITSPTTDDVKTACEAKDNTSQAFCYASLMSLYDAVLVAADAQAAAQPCVPDGTTPEQIRKVFLEYTAKRPTQTGGDIGIFFNLAFEEAYACPKAPAPKPKPRTKK